jgi:hypothetical protein
VAAPEYTSAGRRGSGAEEYVTASELNSRRRGPEPRDSGSIGAHLNRKVRSGAVRHVKVAELTSIGRRSPELHDMWQRMDARPTPYLDLKLVCRVLGLQGADRHIISICIRIQKTITKKNSKRIAPIAEQG